MSQPENKVMSYVCGGWLRWLTIFFACGALIATPLQMLRLINFSSEPFRITVSVGFAFFALVIGMRYSEKLQSISANLAEAMSKVKVWQVLLFGLLLRFSWIVLFPSQPGSDGAVYLDLAKRLSNGESYEFADSRAYWPVGYPLFLSAWIKVVGSGKLAYLLSNFALYICGALGVARLAKILAGERASVLAVLLFSLWPNLIFGSGTPEKELVVVAVSPWAFAWTLMAVEEQGRVSLLVFGVGLLLGLMTLVQPSLQFLPPVTAVLFAISCRTWKSKLRNSLVVILGATILIAPWSIRNYLLFDTPVLVATNGGGNLYRANNPLATGGYTKKGVVDLDQLGEIEHDREGRRLAMLWIKANPKRFLELVVEKQIRFMGDDAGGVYGTFKVGHATGSDSLYIFLKGLANSWWMCIWFMIAFLASRRDILCKTTTLFVFSPIWLWLYLFTIHSVFESSGKYHVPILWVPCVLLSVLLVSSIRERTSP